MLIVVLSTSSILFRKAQDENPGLFHLLDVFSIYLTNIILFEHDPLIVKINFILINQQYY